MNKAEREELNELRQVLGDVKVRIDKAFFESPNSDNLAQGMKALINIDRRLKKLVSK